MAIDATPNGPASNSYGTHAEANAYFADERVPLATPWVTTGQEGVLIMARRVLDSLLAPQKIRMTTNDGTIYYIVRRTWTGTRTTSTQALPWGREGMLDLNGNAIANNVIPKELKYAQFELAGLLRMEDRTLDNAILATGLTSLRAGPVSLSFKDNFVPTSQTLPDAVLNLLVPSWLTDETIEYPQTALFDVISW